jgi:hypothetical protein
MVMPGGSIFLDKIVDQTRIHVGGHIHPDIVGNDEQDIGRVGFGT